MRKVVTVIILLVVILNIMISLFHEGQPTGQYYTEELTDCLEYSVKDSLNGSISHERNWEEFGLNQQYCAIYSVSEQDAALAEHLRNTTEVHDHADDMDVWRELYHNLYIQAKDRLAQVQDSLTHVAGTTAQVDRNVFARIVVAFVQDIPYEYVMSEGCEGRDAACSPNVSWGLYSPVEFMYHLKGDCDTRTVLLYTLLKNFGYSPLIINSREYRHSMLALDIPSAGDDFRYKGQRYAFWETTNVGWLPGMLPPEMNNKAYWNVALDYEYKDQPPRFN